jgi:hypothetical protein
MLHTTELAKMIEMKELAKKYNVSFSIATEYDDTGLTYFYKFGPVTWQKVLNDQLTIADLFEVAQRLAAKFPEKVNV